MLDREAASRATAVTVVVVAALVVGQAAVAAAVTGGTQPVAAVQSVPDDPAADAWADAPERTASLSEQQMAVPFGGGSVDEMTVQTVRNDTHTAFRLSWADATRDASIDRPHNFSDAAAIMLRSGDKPPITMGAAGKPVDIWYWRASWQSDGGGSPGTGSMYSYPHPDDETRPGRAAGNPLSQTSYDRFAQNYYATGYGSLTHAPAQSVSATGERTDDGWSVVFVREHSTDGEYDPDFESADNVYLAFAVWNGSAEEVNGQKSLTLQFTELDTGEWQLSDAPSGSSGDSSGSDGTSGAGGSSDGGMWLTESLSNWVLGLVATTLLTWSVVYWRAKR